jgi:hypothetical protein
MDGGTIAIILVVYAFGGIVGATYNAIEVNGESALRPFIFGFLFWPFLALRGIIKEARKDVVWYKKEPVKTEEELTIEHLKKRRDEVLDEWMELGVELRKLEPVQEKAPEVAKPYSPPPTQCCNASAAPAPQTTVIIREDNGIDIGDVAIGAVIGGLLF